MDHVQFAHLIQQKWFEQPKWVELVNGTPWTFQKNLAVDDISNKFGRILEGCFSGDIWSVNQTKMWFRIDDYTMLTPSLAVYPKMDKRTLEPNEAGIIMDISHGDNEERVRWGRQVYRRRGLPCHILVDILQNYVEVGDRSSIQRYQADDEVPIVLNEVFYGSFRPMDVFVPESI